MLSQNSRLRRGVNKASDEQERAMKQAVRPKSQLAIDIVGLRYCDLVPTTSRPTVTGRGDPPKEQYISSPPLYLTSILRRVRLHVRFRSSAWGSASWAIGRGRRLGGEGRTRPLARPRSMRSRQKKSKSPKASTNLLPGKF